MSECIILVKEGSQTLISFNLFDGPRGDTGLSAYELEVENGFKGDYNAWRASLIGPPVPVAAELGQSADLAVSQKLLTDTVGVMQQANSEAVDAATLAAQHSHQSATTAGQQAGIATAKANAAALVEQSVNQSVLAIAELTNTATEQAGIATSSAQAAAENKRLAELSETEATKQAGFSHDNRLLAQEGAQTATEQAGYARGFTEAAKSAAKTVLQPEWVGVENLYPDTFFRHIELNTHWFGNIYAGGPAASIAELVENPVFEGKAIYQEAGKNVDIRVPLKDSSLRSGDKISFYMLVASYADSEAGIIIHVTVDGVLAGSMISEHPLLSATPSIFKLEITINTDNPKLVRVISNLTAGTQGVHILAFWAHKGGLIGGMDWPHLKSDYSESLLLSERRKIGFDSLSANAGCMFPFKQINPTEVLSSDTSLFTQAILDVKVFGAEEGKFYSIGYFKNGYNGLGVYPDGWAVYERSSLAADAETTSLHSWTHAAPSIPRVGVQTVEFYLHNKPNIKVQITLNTDNLKLFGTFYQLLPSLPLFIISPTQYFQEINKTPPQDSNLPVGYTITSTNRAAMVWASGAYEYRLNFGPNGANSLPNVIGIDRRLAGQTAWAVINATTTDWLPPMVFSAESDGDGTTFGFTGGNHLDPSNLKTAANRHFSILIDGNVLPPNKAVVGRCSNVTFRIVNELMANNTVTLDRYVIRQSFNVVFTAGVLAVECSLTGLEACKVATDYGPQMVTTGFRDEVMFLDGQFQTWTPYDISVHSGKGVEFTSAWATIFKSASGQQAFWVDRSYGSATGEYVNSTAFANSFVSGGKAYNPVISGGGMHVKSMTKGESYKWRGGYAWQAPDVAGADLAGILVTSVKGVTSSVYIQSATDYDTFN